MNLLIFAHITSHTNMRLAHNRSPHSHDIFRHIKKKLVVVEKSTQKCRMSLTIVGSPNYLTAYWCWCVRLTIRGALVAMIQTNKYLTWINLNDISAIIFFFKSTPLGNIFSPMASTRLVSFSLHSNLFVIILYRSKAPIT